MAFELILFYVFAAIVIAASLLVVVQTNPVYSVLLLIGSFIGLAGLYVLLAAPFVAVIQIIVYAGAIMVLFLFVVMLLNAPREEPAPSGVFESGTTRAIGAILALAFALELAWALQRSRLVASTGALARQRSFSVPEIGERLFQEYAFAFEATSILILVAMLGAIALAGRHLSPATRLSATARRRSASFGETRHSHGDGGTSRPAGDVRTKEKENGRAQL